MKKRYIMAGILAVSIILLVTIPFAAAQPEPPNPTNGFDSYPSLNEYSNKYIVIWSFKTTDTAFDSFDGRTIVRSTVQCWAEAFNPDGTPGAFILVKPMLVLTLKDDVLIFFLRSDLPVHSASGAVTGALKTASLVNDPPAPYMFDASGPGWTYGHV
jgi:hypothetical protein